jgi:hypothetical protein
MKTYAEMQDGEIVPVYEYHYTGTVTVWTDEDTCPDCGAALTDCICDEMAAQYEPMQDDDGIVD